jgi:hypothetical protein
MKMDDLIDLAAKHDRVVKPSMVDPKMCCLDCGPATNPNERGRMTADGAFLTVDEGRYWQVGPVKDVANYFKGLEKNNA